MTSTSYSIRSLMLLLLLQQIHDATSSFSLSCSRSSRPSCSSSSMFGATSKPPHRHYLISSLPPVSLSQSSRIRSVTTTASRISTRIRSANPTAETNSPDQELDPLATSDALSSLSSQPPLITINDIQTILKHFAFCFFISIVFSFYEGYDCTYLKPLPATIRQFPTDNDVLLVQNSNNNIIDEENKQQKNLIHDILQLMKSGTRGMGRGEIDRVNGWFQATYFGADYDIISTSDDNIYIEASPQVSQGEEADYLPALSPYQLSRKNVNALRNIKSYNEVMQYHRENRVQRWKENDQSMSMSMNSGISTKSSLSSSITTSTMTPPGIQTWSQQQQQQTPLISSQQTSNQIKQIQNAIHTIYVALDSLEQLKIAANDYDWGVMEDLLQSDVLKIQLESSCNLLRSSIGYLDLDARQEIGFDWGSCAWRHCGAQADAQESLAELYNSIGLFEPFECLFTIDIVERSLRDIVNVVPIKYHSKEDIQNLQPYVKYKSQQEINLENGFSDNDDGMDSSDVDYLNILNGLRSSNDDSDE